MTEKVLFKSGFYNHYSENEEFCKGCDQYEEGCKRDISECYGFIEQEDFDCIMQEIKSVFDTSVLIGTLGLWHGKPTSFKLCSEFKDLERAVSGYDDITITQLGTRLFFALHHHDGTNHMELRRFNKYGSERLNEVCLDYFSEENIKFIKRCTKNFGKVA